MDVHVVKRGETLWRIALVSNRTIEQLASCNGIADPSRIEAGQVLRIPPKTVAAQCPMALMSTPYFEYGVVYPEGHRFAGKVHTGIDFHVGENSPIFAIAPGVVRVSKMDRSGYGWYNLIEHRLLGNIPIYSLNAHMNAAGPEVGAIVDNFAIVGREGSSGAGSGEIVHNHFELKQTDELELFGKVNPGNLDNYFYNPREVLENEEFQFLPLWCWDCNRCQ